MNNNNINDKSLKDVLEIRYIVKIFQILTNILGVEVTDKSLIWSDAYQEQGLRIKIKDKKGEADILLFDAADCYAFHMLRGECSSTKILTPRIMGVNTKLLKFLKERVAPNEY